MFATNISRILYLIIILIIRDKINAQSVNCNLNKVQYPTVPVPRIVLSYQCYPSTIDNPQFPTGGSKPSEYNEVNLSPNMYTSVPIANMCEFVNIYLFDISYNKLTSITNLFKDLKCLVSLKTLIMSYNFISSKIVSSDFDDTFSAQLEYIDLSSNQIPSIDSDVFIKSGGTSRFTNLKYLNLANNRIKEFDLLPPLTIPSGVLNLNFSSNPINVLKNQLNIKYSDNIFSYPVVGNRKVDVTNNILEKFDDSNLLQYGLGTSYDLLAFLNKIANYDLRQLNYQRINCSCTTSQSTVSWYQSLITSSSINQNNIINQFTCYNSTLFVLSVNPNCQILPTTTVLTTTTTLAATTTNNLTADFGFLVSNTSTTTSSLYYLFFLLFIPLIIIIILVVCCCFRPINKCLYNCCNATCCTSCRPGENLKARKVTKKYDATICYSEYDEAWVHTKLVPLLAKQGKAYKIHLLTSYHQGFSKIDKNELEKLKASKRVILVFSKNFLKEEWKSASFQNQIKSLSAHDRDCVIIPINLGDMTKEVMDENLDNLLEYNDYEASCLYCSNRLKHSTTLKNIEPLHSANANFGKDIQFLMPIKKNTRTAAIITDNSHAKRNAQSPSELSIIKFESEGGSDVSRNGFSPIDDKPLVSTKRKFRKSRIAPSNLLYKSSGSKTEKVKTTATRNESNNSNSTHDISINSVVIKPSKTSKLLSSYENDSKSNRMKSSSPSDLSNLEHKKSQNENINDLSLISEESGVNILNTIPFTRKDTTNGILPRDIIFDLERRSTREKKSKHQLDQLNRAEHVTNAEILRSRSHEKYHSKHHFRPRTARSEHSRPREEVPRELYSNYLLDEDDKHKHKKHRKSRKNRDAEEETINKNFKIHDKMNIIRLNEWPDKVEHIVLTTSAQEKTFMHN